jgi:predicted nuclease of restriction endonuclease-like (RecB) superfamily
MSGLAQDDGLLQDIRGLIEEARSAVAVTVNAGLTMLHWQIGRRIRQEVLQETRAEYGAQIVATVSRQLRQEFGTRFSEKSLRRMMQFYEVFPEEEKVFPLLKQLTWSHFVELIPLSEPFQRDFYTEICRVERWSVRTLRKKIDSMLYERTAISRKPEELIRSELDTLQEDNRLSPDLVFRDPYFLDFLGLKDQFQEQDLEAAILREIEAFLLEMGAGFTFVERQKRIQIDSDDFYIDLLLYHRKLRRLVAIELKTGRFKAEYKGQMELYLRWLDRYDREPHEEAPLGIILCAGKKQEQIELLELDQSGIHVAEYLTALPPIELLQKKLRSAVEQAQLRLTIGQEQDC